MLNRTGGPVKSLAQTALKMVPSRKNLIYQARSQALSDQMSCMVSATFVNTVTYFFQQFLYLIVVLYSFSICHVFSKKLE